MLSSTLFFLSFPGGLALAVEGPSKAEINCVDNKDGTCSVSYLPYVPGEYNIIIKFADAHISGSPFVAKISGPGKQWGERNIVVILGLEIGR